MLFSIITVCFNAEDSIAKTLTSVKEQRYKNFEHIIIDGASTDKTMVIIKEYKEDLDNVIVISEKDDGIYDAMNKGVKLASGDYIMFLNSGDIFYDENVLLNISAYAKSNIDLIYGDYFIGQNKVKSPDKIQLSMFILERNICHQTIFAKKEIFDLCSFQCKYKYCADRHWLYSVYKLNKSFKHINLSICYYDISGVSSDLNNFLPDSLKVIHDEFGSFGVLIVRVKRRVKQIYNKLIILCKWRA